MSRLSVLLAIPLSLMLSSLAFSQTGGTSPVPGSATGAALPGMATQNPRVQTGTARIRGRIVDAQTGMPLRRAQITLGIPASQPRATVTDSEGRFEFARLPAGRYAVVASKTGFVTLQYGQRLPTDVTDFIVLANGEQRDGIDLALPRGGVIAVRVTDDFGDPVPGAQVSVQRYQYGLDGQRRLNSVYVLGGMGQSATDDRGETRMYGLQPGDYVVSAMLRNPALPSPDPAINDGFALTYHPGTLNAAEAQTVTVSLGEETTIAFAMALTRLARVSGTAVDWLGRPAAGSFAQLVSNPGTITTGGAGSQVAPDGTFTLTAVPPGEYSLDVRTQLRPDAGRDIEFGSMPITIAGADITGVRVVTGRGATVSGRVIFEGTLPRASNATPLRVIATPADPSKPFTAGAPLLDPQTNGSVDENGHFRLAGLSGRMFFGFSNAAWTITSISLDGEDVTDEPIDLTGRPSAPGMVIRLTDKTTQISGHVTDGRGQTTRECAVVFQSAEVREPIVAARLMRVVRCDSSGAFRTAGMRPGRYVVTAVTSVDRGYQYDPEFQQQLRRASESFTIREGETMTLDLKLTSGL
jgi:uncharacterized protein (DUF2141 family)